MSDETFTDDNSMDPSDMEGEDMRRNRCRERNKEHARKTRIRKKEQLDALKSKINQLEAEGRRLKQEIEDCSVATILIGLSSGYGVSSCQELSSDKTCAVSSTSPTSFTETLNGGKRKRFLSLDGTNPTPPPMKLNVKGQVTLVGGTGNDGKAQLNWKTGVYFDELGRQQQLTKTELEDLRRERNRMHAKMTRDRKKCFVASMQRVIAKLEQENNSLRKFLERSRMDSNREEKQSQDLASGMSEQYHPANKDLKESTTALLSISNSSIFTIG